MPIRTPRGRSAAYRSVWQWPLRSPVRLAVTVAAVLALAIGISAVASATRPDSVPLGGRYPATVTVAPGRPLPAGSPAAATVLPPVAPLTPTELPVTVAPAAALGIASAWATAWVDHPAGTTAQQWLNRLRPLTTDEYLGVLSGVDPGNVPATRVTGPVRAVHVAPNSVRVEVQTDALTLLLLVVDTGSGWRVAGSDRA